ncbi:MAG: hypothetical protein R6V04_10260 [bacterium]
MRILIILVIFLSGSYVRADIQSDSLQAKLRTAVTLSTSVDPKQIPLNRTSELTVRLTWKGDIDYIEIKEIEEPILSNLEIVGSSASNKTIDTEDGVKAIKEISYRVRPLSLGMGYVETVGVSYDDKLSGKTYNLNTERIGIEAVSAVPERGEIQIPWIWISAGLIIVITGGTGIYYFYRKRADSEEGEKEVQILEEKYLDELKNMVDLSSGDKNESFTILSKLFRKYLSEKYEISALETTTDELIHLLSSEELQEDLIRKSKALFSKADVVKFSGKKATQAEVDEAYTTVETILETHCAQERKAREKKEEEDKKSSKRFLKKGKEERDKDSKNTIE